MARRASARAVEICLPASSAAGRQIGDLDAAAAAAERFRFDLGVVDERDDRAMSASVSVNGGMPLSGRPARIIGPSLLPRTSRRPARSG